MGFFPVMQGKLERFTDDHGHRKIRAQVFDEVSSKWIVREFDGYNPDEALAWIGQKMKELEM